LYDVSSAVGVSLGLYGGSRTQDGGFLVVFQGNGIQLEGEREEFEED
jgi:hypothetical protein